MTLFKLLVATITSLIGATATASGGVSCTSQIKAHPISLAWGVGRVVGSTRISPYQLTIAGKRFLINDKEDRKIHRWGAKRAKDFQQVELREVGYYHDGERIAVLWSDQQVNESWLKLLVGKTKQGQLTGNIEIAGPFAKNLIGPIEVHCYVE